jgi:hypothetical protein
MLPIEMIQLAETELDVVCSGYSENNISASNFGLNITVPQVESVRGGPSNVANIAQGSTRRTFPPSLRRVALFSKPRTSAYSSTALAWGVRGGMCRDGSLWPSLVSATAPE